MRKFLISSFAVILTCGLGFGQENSAAKVGNPPPVAQINYSESTPYQPFKFEQPEVKNKKKSKSNKNSDNNQQSAASGSLSNVESGGIAPAGEKAFKISVSVFNRNGNPVANLTKSDFKVFINDREQEISDFEIATSEPLNVFLILDVSPSTSNSIEDIKRFATELTAVLKPEDKIQIIRFDYNVKILCELTNDRNLIEKAIKKLDWGDGTSLYDAIHIVLQKSVNSNGGRKAVVLLSDGVDTTSHKQSYETSLIAAEKSDALFFTFFLDTYQDSGKIKISPGGFPFPLPGGIAQRPRGMDKRDYEIGKQYMVDLSWLSGGKAFEIMKISELKKADFVNIPTVIKPQYTIGINLPNTANTERRQVKVRVNRPNLKIEARGSLIVGDDK
ncbi:MAG TPA: VWA domain-containing protein [Pyrinomonadaceae bacterium]|jgi:VWFA-related protein